VAEICRYPRRAQHPASALTRRPWSNSQIRMDLCIQPHPELFALPLLPTNPLAKAHLCFLALLSPLRANSRDRDYPQANPECRQSSKPAREAQRAGWAASALPAAGRGIRTQHVRRWTSKSRETLEGAKEIVSGALKGGFWTK